MNALKQRWQSGCMGKAMIVGGVLVILFTCMVCGAMALVSAPSKTPSGEIRATGQVTPKPLERAAATVEPTFVAGVAPEVATSGPTSTPRPTATPVPPTSTPLPTDTPGPTSTPVPTDTPEPTATPVPPTATPEPGAALRALVEAGLGKGNRDVPRIKDVYLGSDDGTIAVSWAISDNLTEGMVKRGARMEVIDILKAIKVSGAPFDVVNLFGSFSMVDKYGNASEMPVVKLVYTKATFGKLNLDSPLLTDTIYEAADNAAIHPAFQGE